MHFFVLLLLMSFGVMALTAFGESVGQLVRVPWNRRDARPFLAGAFGVGLAWLANFNMWTGWSIGQLRYDWVGITITGIAVGGVALLTHALVAFFAGLNRKFDDQAEQIERTDLRRVA